MPQNNQVWATVIEDSVCNGVRLTTLKVRYHRMIHAEFLRHRVLSRCAASSRAIPVTKMASSATAEPLHWGANQAGMQAGTQLAGWRLWAVKSVWRLAGFIARRLSVLMAKLGAHKQIANRLTESHQWMEEVITGTDWDNFFNLRCHEAAQPEIFAIASAVKNAMELSEPKQVKRDFSSPWNWHLPFIQYEERLAADKGKYDTRSRYYNCLYLAKLSAARVARVSYLNHDGSKPDAAKDLALFARLTADPKALHASPMEHQAYPLNYSRTRMRNFRGWKQFRILVEAGEAE